MKLSGVLAILLREQLLTIVDVGAAGGLHPRWKPAAGHLRTVGFEPLDPPRDDGRDMVLSCALGSSSRPGQLMVTRRISMTSLLPPARDLLARFWDKSHHTEVVERVPVELRRLDDLASEKGLRPDMLKIDVQGAEHDVLLGAAECLDRQVLAAEIELSFIERYEGLTTFEGIVAFMREHGFELFDLWRVKRYRYRNRANLVDPAMVPGLRAGRLAFCDALFLRRDDALEDAVRGSREQAGKIMALCLIYGKADFAARLHDIARDGFSAEDNRQIDEYWLWLAKRRSRPLLHRAIDKWGRRL